jgi:2-isopropylmalate synthase
VLAERTTYEVMDPVELGYDGSRLVLGKHSGRHAVADALAKLGFKPTAEELDQAFVRFKQLADRKARITDTDLEAIVADEVRAERQSYRFVGLQVAGGTVLTPTATVRISHDGTVTERSAMGDGMVDAACAAVAEAVGIDAPLVAYNVSAVTGGADALGDVSVQVESGGTRVSGRAVAADVVEASARAYLQAVNKLVGMGVPTGAGPVQAGSPRRAGTSRGGAPVTAATANGRVRGSSSEAVAPDGPRVPAVARRDGQPSPQAAQDAMGRVFGVAVQAGEA